MQANLPVYACMCVCVCVKGDGRESRASLSMVIRASL